MAVVRGDSFQTRIPGGQYVWAEEAVRSLVGQLTVFRVADDLVGVDGLPTGPHRCVDARVDDYGDLICTWELV